MQFEVLTLNQGIRAGFIKRQRSSGLQSTGKNACVQFHSVVTGIISDDMYVYLVPGSTNNPMLYSHFLGIISSSFFTAYHIFWKIACIRNSPTLNCYALRNGICLCTWKQLILQARLHGKVKPQNEIYYLTKFMRLI